MRDWLWVVVGLLVLAGGFALHQFGPQSGLLSSQGDAKRVVVDSDCDLRQGQCQLNLDGKAMVFSIEPSDIRTLMPLTLQLSIPGVVVGGNPAADGAVNGSGKDLAFNRISVEFEGVNMDMGYNRVILEAKGKGRFVGSGMLAACTAETMIWRVHLLLETDERVYDYRFALETSSPSQ